MNTPEQTLHDAKIESLAARYGNEGYLVIKQPKASDLPFDLDGYAPDLIATKGDSGLIVEVKSSAARMSVERLQSLAKEISTHPGWRFLLVTLDDVDSKKVPTTANELPTWGQLMEKSKQAETLIENGVLEAGLLYLWSIFEAALRKRAIEQNIPVERFPASMLLNHMYSQGEVSVDQLDSFRDFMSQCDRIAHGANETIVPNTARTLAGAVRELLIDWAEAKAI